MENNKETGFVSHLVELRQRLDDEWAAVEASKNLI